MFHGVSLRLLHNNPLGTITPILDRLQTEGADAVAIIPHHYVYLAPGTPNLAPPPPASQPSWFLFPDLGQDPSLPFKNSPEPEHVLEVCRAASARGVQVMLKPHNDSYDGGWRGDIVVKHLAGD